MNKILRVAVLGLIVVALVSSILGSGVGAMAQNNPAPAPAPTIFPTGGTDGPNL
jgi:hypothetical protein